ncbi:Uncharacterised protein [Yersinia frederiksenii]|uniref:Secreted protein n=1 Tax=Yersinia intermedia TaxID=631 RepID=A0A0T9LSA7_YERIN|nr:Uncharacterised protein [Yersinia intermedia]CNL32457.1 Uncharacterised protein [Yersinia frederiksenii]
MSYIFLIIVISSQSSNMQVTPMQSMEQCEAAIKSIDILHDQGSWSDYVPRINQVKCVEVKP